jgi:hypothetical protein
MSMTAKRLGRFHRIYRSGLSPFQPGRSRAPWRYPSHRNFAFTEPHFFPEENLEPANQMGGGGILIDVSYPNSDVQNGCTLGFQRCRTTQLQDCSGVQMPLSLLVSAEVPAVALSVAVQDLLSGAAQPFPSDCTSEPNRGVNSRRF